ncbi:MAG: polymerase subunit gamma/tau [Solirubrobacteraceae bacterium]|nr:polymerase subunit gamma/tau [Solirubrobacteraceae bacterium]
MSTSPSLYRRHRPRTFAEVVGQEHVVRTLSNAVVRDMVHHAYLFVGSRGTGKTSMAKILAACLNCRDAPTITPCGTCDSCRSIASATSLDVIEMDAASSNSVDDIRALRESVAYAPVSGGQKVYILDEAHMLSTAAWNAFLKTLEEPPPNTIFVLATTEAQKVLPTVVDRCHRFDFHRPTADQIATVLRRTAVAEEIDVPPAAVALLARHASGSFRDALGTLEQLRTYSGPTILLDDVLAVLGVADAELLFATLEAVHAGDPRRALEAVAGAVDTGRDPAGFVRELEAHVREVLVVQTLDLHVPPEIAVTPERDDQISDQATRIPPATLVRLLDLLAAALAALRNGADGRTQLELALVKAARPPLDASTDALLERIARLEAALAGSPPTPAPRQATPAAPQAPPAAPQPDPARSRSAPAVPADHQSVPSPPPPAEPPPPPPSRAPKEPEAAPQQTASNPPAPPTPEPLTLERVIALWPAVLDAVGTANRMLAAVIAGALPVELTDRRLVLAFPLDSAFLRRKAEDSPNRIAVADALRLVTGRTLTLAYDLREPTAPSEPPATLTDAEWVARLKVEFDARELDA